MKNILMMMVLSFPLLLYGQQGVLSTGGDATGSGGTSSFSVGQVAYTYTGSGSSLDAGLQQAFELSALPIELLYFDAEMWKGHEVKLTWETATELNNDYFTIDRSENGRDWEYVGKVSGSGTTTEGQSYGYVDLSPYKDLSYYRLKQTDYDGNFTYSEIRTVQLLFDGVISVYPNPFRDFVALQGIADFPVDYLISDYYGKLVRSGKVIDGQTQLELADLLPGIYLLEMQSKGESIFTQKIIKL